MLFKRLALTSGLLGLASARYALILPPGLFTGPITADYITPSLDQSDLDAPKLSHANASTFDWWTFDAIAAETPNASVAVTFSNAGPQGYPLPFPNNTSHINPNGTDNGGSGAEALWAHVWATFEDGSRFRTSQVVSTARVSGSGDSSLAIWHGGGGWMGSEEGYEVELDIDRAASAPGEEALRVSGRISLEKITPPHSRCSVPNNFSTALGLGDQGLGWVSVLPDALASVDIQINGRSLRFDGYGSHDKIWSSHPFTTTTKSLTRGRAHLGLFSLSWLSYTPAAGNPTNAALVSSFLARDGETVNAGCADGSVTITPTREQTEGGLVSGFQVTVPGARVSVATDIEEGESGGRHVRWNGRARGDILGADEEGVAIFERFEY